MSLFISLSSTTKLFGILISPPSGNSWSSCIVRHHLPVFYIRRKWDRSGIRDNGAGDPVLFYKNCEAIPLNRLDKIIGGAQVQAPGLVVHDGDHNHRNLRQFRIALEPIEKGPSITFRHDYVEGNKERTNLLGQGGNLLLRWRQQPHGSPAWLENATSGRERT